MIDLIAVLVTVLLTGSELAIGVFVHPVLSKLQDAAHAEAVKPLARLFGRVMPFWYAAALLLVVVSLLTRASGSWSWWACLSSAALLAVTVPFSLICLVPINNRVAAWCQGCTDPRGRATAGAMPQAIGTVQNFPV
jgi:hypothetical protein